MKKIVFQKIPKIAKEKTSQQIRVTTEIYDQLIKICEETGLTLCKVTSKIIKAALPFVELQESPFTPDDDELEDEDE